MTLDAIPELRAVLAPSTLVIGDILRWSAEGRDIVDQIDVAYLSFTSLDEERLQELEPAIVLSPLVADSFDALDIVERLVELGFRGRYRAICTGSEDVELIKGEVKALAPDLDFDILDVK